jgi:hypothetical protein
VDIPASDIPASTIPATCFDVANDFALRDTTIRTGGYERIDPLYSMARTTGYWNQLGSTNLTPDPTAAGFGQYNAAGYPKNQYVRPYVRSDGTAVSGYWRNSPSDGLPTCDVISC